MQNDHHWLQMRNIRRMEERVRVRLRRRIVRDHTNPFEDLAEEEFLLRFRLSNECELNLLQNIRAQLPIAADARVLYIPANHWLHRGVVYIPAVYVCQFPPHFIMNRRDSELTKRAQIVALHDLGLSSRVIATRLAVFRTTVLKWIRRHEETGILTDLGK
ncbi:hypothetical protein Pcinc_007212 [Petrolisthes cinctipes]|uniref:Uncharacterized protein n=1 Tax=Petrolisthes cinctipes TaxID=88211 RepID=A0AAE1GBF8_PETCI|nr:hypothetical protein Pcinc_007212 [Petrolisthes cinctipes]